MITFGSVCSGIEAATVAWSPIGFKASWLSEIEPFPSQVLSYHYPSVENLGDMTQVAEKIKREEICAPDVLVGGTPCQSFSVAGLRKGLKDDRGALTISFVEIADAIDNVRRRNGKQESVIVWENVPGVLSSKDNAFGCFLGALAGESSELIPPGGWTNAGCVHGPQRTIAWRVLDAQYFGLAQRRKRVFVVASAREGFDPTKVLFEFQGVRRDVSPFIESKKTMQQGLAGCSNRAITNDRIVGTLVARDHKDVSAYGFCDGKFAFGKNGLIRKFTPVECERLFGFPDNYTQIPWRNRPAEDCPDGHRYKALGNSMAVPVMCWIGERIKNEINNLGGIKT